MPGIRPARLGTGSSGGAESLETLAKVHFTFPKAESEPRHDLISAAC
jgi:hypothetical protein